MAHTKPCKHLMDISPYPPLCDNPMYYYDGGPIKAYCEGCEEYEEEQVKTPIPNRLAQVPDDLYELLDRALDGYDQRKMARAVLRMAYGRGYMDGYRDGHTDAENGHDERVRAVVS